eukprot:769424-Amphidinium_carterae.2
MSLSHTSTRRRSPGEDRLNHRDQLTSCLRLKSVTHCGSAQDTTETPLHTSWTTCFATITRRRRDTWGGTRTKQTGRDS